MTTWTPPTSYIEDRFYSFCLKTTKNAPAYQLTRQYLIPSPYPDYPYHTDFCHVATRTVIELDGRAYHTSPDQIERDIARQRFIEAQGYAVIRFTGSDMYRRPVKSIYKARRLINARLHNDT